MTHQPLRTCLGCRTKAGQADLIRLVLKTTAETPAVVWDRARKLPGRGAWIHPGTDCLQQALKKGAFHRAFRTRVSTAELVIEA